MLGRVFGVLCIISVICAAVTGKISELGVGVAKGASGAVTVSLGLLGAMALWNGIIRVLEAAGATKALAAIASPVLRLVFPDAYRKKHGIAEITAAVTANMLGLGNAATPLSIAAMKALAENGGEEFAKTGRATDEMVTFAVLSTASLDLIPTTLLALRTAAGSAAPDEILVPVWICSGLCAAFAIFISRAPAILEKQIQRAINGKISGKTIAAAASAGVMPDNSSNGKKNNATQKAFQPGNTGEGRNCRGTA